MDVDLSAGPFSFIQSVNGFGYEWRAGKEGGIYLVARTKGDSRRGRDTLDAGLFRSFAATSLNRDAVRDFADRYGQLFTRFSPIEGAVKEDGSFGSGSSWLTWKREIQDMRALVTLWEQVRARDSAALESYIVRKDFEVGYVFNTPRRRSNTTIAHARIPTSDFDRYVNEGVAELGAIALQWELNKRLAEEPSTARLIWDGPKNPRQQRISLSPPNLLGLMWLQLAAAISGNIELYPCAVCGRLFQRGGTHGTRSDRTTCSDVCRKRKSRNAQKTA